MSDYTGVRYRGWTVEIKKWFEGVGFCKDFKTADEGALVHDLCVIYSNLDVNKVDFKKLNIEKLGVRIQEEDPALASFGEPLHIGKEFLIDFMKKNPVSRAGADSKQQANSMKKQIVELAPRALKSSKDWIAREHSSLAAGRQRKDLKQIHPPVLEDGILELSKEIQDLRATISAQNEALRAKDVGLDSALKAKDVAMDAALKANAALEAMYAALVAKDSALEKMDAALMAKDSALEKMDAALMAKDTELETMDAVLKNVETTLKSAPITSLQEKLYPVDKLAAIVTLFKQGFAEPEELHQNESNPDSETWMECIDWTAFDSHLPTG